MAVRSLIDWIYLYLKLKQQTFGIIVQLKNLQHVASKHKPVGSEVNTGKKKLQAVFR